MFRAMSPSTTLVFALSVGSVALVACESGSRADDGVEPVLPDCIELDIDGATCTPLFPATFDRIYEEVFAGVDGASGCAAGGSACHGQSDALGATAGMVFAGDRDAVYTAVSSFVEAGDPHCGPLSVRVHTKDLDFVMPPGSSGVDEGARCAIAQWVADGAVR